MKLKLTKETVASHSFFSPIRLNYPYVLTRQDQLTEVYEMTEKCQIKKLLQVAEANLVYDYFWTGENFYVVLVKDHPIFLRSLETGKTVQKYPIYSHLYEVKTPYCGFYDKNLIFSCLGNTIHQIDVISGQQSKISIKSKKIRPRTVTSSITQSGKLIGIGSHSSVAFLIDLSSGRTICEIQSVPRISQMMIRELNLYIGGTSNDFIEVWDLRMRRVPKHIQTISRHHPTHQKILFDVNSSGMLATGDAEGDVKVFNSSFELVASCPSHFDAVNSVQFSTSGIVSSSGQRHFNTSSVASLIREFIWSDN